MAFQQLMSGDPRQAAHVPTDTQGERQVEKQGLHHSTLVGLHSH